MGNVESSSSNPRRKIQRKSSRHTGCKNNFLEDRDLDNIYKFVQHLKTTNVGADMLGEFVAKQAARVDDEINEVVKGVSPVMDEKSSPIKSIEISLCVNDQS
jgi:hypothetical protein